MEDEDTAVGPAPRSNDTDRALAAASLATADTGEWDDTDREMLAQGTIEHTPPMFEDTGVVIVDRPVEIKRTDRFVVTFREPSQFQEEEPTMRDLPRAATPRASTAGEWPPPPREPAIRAPQIRERALKRAGVYKIVTRPDTKN